MIIELSTRSKVFYTSFFLRTAEKSGFFLQGRRIIPGKKAGFLSRADIENLWIGTVSCERPGNPAFSFTGGGSFREKSRVSSPGRYRKLMDRYCFLRTAEKPGFFLQGRRIIPGKKAGFLSRAHIENL
ncbi:Uncharacterized protein dnm_058970 [Desulfonema magnum]|uniref:Uncharacterized protein n=1 Tax=Desulfonema magnum TaxID=45655 RepID=A0A975BQS3_9BACT|nr:Uncharacterized protein dnm_058970 [Desulfonema magnum]